MKPALIIPARDEEACIGDVVREARAVFGGAVIVVDNGSSDATSVQAAEAGATVVSEPTPGYGRACSAGIAGAPAEADVLVFMDGDGSDRPEDIAPLLAAIDGGADPALAVRRGAGVEPGSITPAARFGNWLSGALIGLASGRRLHDLSPLKAIRRQALERLGLREQTYGWTVEMLARAVAARLNIVEVEAGYRHRRGGQSKVSGNLAASMSAGYRILLVLGRVGLRSFGPARAGAVAGAMSGIVLVVLFGAWLLGQAPSNGRVLIAALLIAWPVLLVTTTAGFGTGYLVRRRRSSAIERRSPSV